MEKPSSHESEPDRLAALAELELLDTPPEETFDRCLVMAAELCGTSAGGVSLVDRERQWFKAIFGRLPKESSREISFCGHVIAHEAELVVPDALLDPRFEDNPFVTSGILRFYAGIPLTCRAGLPIGTLCVIHHEPHALSEGQLAALRVIADALERHLEMRLLALRAGAAARDAAARALALAEIDAKRSETTEMLAHDLKNPLAAVSLLAHQARESPMLAPDVRESLDLVIAAAQAAEHLVNDMLDVARADRGQLPVKHEDFDLGLVARRCVRRVEALAAARGQTIRVRDELDGEPVHGDSLLIVRAIRNFLDNAVKYAPRGTEIELVLRRREDDSVEIRVEDRGASVPEAERTRIFEKYRVGRAAREGQGLGLALCARVAEAHGGRAWVEPRPGGGNAFCVEIAG